jgi:NTE family protein
VEGFRNLIDERIRMQEVDRDLSFDGLSEPSEKAYFNGLPTSFSLTGEQVDKLIAVGGRLLEENPDFREFMKEAF